MCDHSKPKSLFVYWLDMFLQGYGLINSTVLKGLPNSKNHADKAAVNSIFILNSFNSSHYGRVYNGVCNRRYVI